MNLLLSYAPRYTIQVYIRLCPEENAFKLSGYFLRLTPYVLQKHDEAAGINSEREGRHDRRDQYRCDGFLLTRYAKSSEAVLAHCIVIDDVQTVNAVSTTASRAVVGR